MSLEPDRDQIEVFVDAMFRYAGTEGYASVRSFLANNKVFRISTAKLAGGLRHLIDVAVDDARRAANDPKTVVFCPPLAVFNGHEWRAREDDLMKGLALSVECDQHPDEALSTLEEILGPATLIVKSGGQWIDADLRPRDKLHLHWRLSRAAIGDQLARLKQARRLAAAIAGADTSNVPTVHCLRWPGSWHRKNQPRLCEIARAAPDAEIDLAEALANLQAAAPQPTQANGRAQPEASTNAQPWDDLVANIIAGINLHHGITSLAAKYARAGAPIGASINQVRAMMNASAAREMRPAEWKDRFNDIPRAFDTAYDKFAEASTNAQPPQPDEGVRLRDFVAYMQSHDYVYLPAGDFWPADRINARMAPILLFDRSGKPIVDDKGEHKEMRPSAWLAKHAPVEQMTWAPGLAQLVRHKLIGDGGWIDRKGVTVLNLYRPPTIVLGDAAKAEPWLAHVRKIYPDEADHIIAFLAHRVQRPHEKINHGLVLGGLQGIGKDTLLEPAKHAVGPWNFAEVSPQQMLGRFNGFVKSVVLRISEAKDMGESDRFKFHAHMKAYMAAPPDVLRVDEKNLREHSVFNVCGVVMTTNHKTDGIYLPADDRRHFVAWSEKTKDDFTEADWNELWSWYEGEGFGHVAAYLAEFDLSDFNPKAPPKKTTAFWAIVDANRAPEDAELADVLDGLGKDAVTLDMLINKATGGIEEWLRDRKNRRAIPHRLETCGYVPVRNDAAEDGLFKIKGRRQAVYAKADLSVRERLEAGSRLVKE